MLSANTLGAAVDNVECNAYFDDVEMFSTEEECFEFGNGFTSIMYGLSEGEAASNGDVAIKQSVCGISMLSLPSAPGPGCNSVFGSIGSCNVTADSTEASSNRTILLGHTPSQGACIPPLGGFTQGSDGLSETGDISQQCQQQ